MKKTNTVLADRKFDIVCDEAKVLLDSLFSYVDENPKAAAETKELLHAVAVFCGDHVDQYLNSEDTND